MKQTYVIHPGRKTNQVFDPVRLHQSIVTACLAVRSYEGEAHDTAELVCRKVIDWLAPKAEVTASDIRRVTARHLETYHPDAAYMYQQVGVMV